GRLQVACLALSAIFVGSEGFKFVFERLGWLEVNPYDSAGNAAGLLLSLAVYFAARSGRLSGQRLTDLGLLYELVICFTFSLLEVLPPGEGGGFAAVLVVLFPALIPAPPSRTFATALASVSTVPLTYYGLQLIGVPVVQPDDFTLFVRFATGYVAAFLAVAPSYVITRLVKDAAEARELGSYTLHERLGEGGMGEVWKAGHRLLARPAAVKLIRSTRVDPQALTRFEREAQATAVLRSPHTVVVYDFGLHEDGTFYYVMELLDGLDLESLVKRFGPVPPARAAHLLRQVCRSLSEAHAAGLVHRDIKPANLYCCRMGAEFDFIKVLDFGLVKGSPGSQAHQDLTDPDAVFGTPAFMSPEQARGLPLDGKADLYSLGCVACWLLTGRYVFDSPTPVGMLMEHLSVPPQPPSQRTSTPIPAELDRLVLDCLAKDPAARPASAEEVEKRLAALNLAGWGPDEAREWWQRNLP
ncbi:MAG: serine/threonine-protein kinase, partial [Candidatus Eremiobacterota bacterium]